MKRKDAGRRLRPSLLPGTALALIIGALVLAGCGGSSGGGSSGESSSTTENGGSTTSSESPGGEAGEGPGGFDISEEARACLKEKGVELPEFKGGGEGGPPMGENGEPPEGFEPPEGGELPEGGEGGPPQGGGFSENSKAFEECGVEMPEFKAGPGGEGGGPNVNSAAFRKQVKEYVACVRENGYELAEPNFSGEGPIFEKSESESAAFKKASEGCQSLLGGPQGSQSG
ncbi:MAG: hypothetical protein J0H06_05515 [Actinobacteria bacterium]|nr:hypothetical protein [Actinomycetota bacterium]